MQQAVLIVLNPKVPAAAIPEIVEALQAGACSDIIVSTLTMEFDPELGPVTIYQP